MIAAARAAGGMPEIVHREPGQNCAALVVSGRGLLLTLRSHAGYAEPGLRLVGLEASPPLYQEGRGVWLSTHLSEQSRVLASLLQARFAVAHPD